MSSVDTEQNPTQLDLSDLGKWVGKPVVFAEMWDPCNATDIRRWVQAMDYGHGCHPSCIGKIPGSHLIFGGEEWWFYGSRIRPGDKLFQSRRFDGYDVADTKLAGPTVFTRGDTVHRNQHGALVAKERATAIRYLVDEAKKRGMYDKEKRAPKRWSSEEIDEINKQRHQWILSNREGHSPHFKEVKVGDKLPRRVIGPHSVVTFAMECRAHRQNI